MKLDRKIVTVWFYKFSLCPRPISVSGTAFAHSPLVNQPQSMSSGVSDRDGAAACWYRKPPAVAIDATSGLLGGYADSGMLRYMISLYRTLRWGEKMTFDLGISDQTLDLFDEMIDNE